MSRIAAFRPVALAGVAVMAFGLLGGPVTAGSASGAAPAPSPTTGPSYAQAVSVPAAPGSDETIDIDTDVYLPFGVDSAPAVLLAHGFGASKDALADDAERLRGEGFVVMAYSARGFGDSGGRISLDSLDYEVADAEALVDVLDEMPEVEHDGGDPVVGVAGASYGGALALMLGATDPRIDSVVASITWNDLAQALVPQSGVVLSSQAVGTDDPSTYAAEPGVFKVAWASQLFGDASSPRAGACGRFTAEFCTLYTKLVDGGTLDAEDRALLERSSPVTVLDDMTAPTLLLQGREDTLFGLNQADANARQIAAAGTEVRVAWFAGGHDGGSTRGTTEKADAWLGDHLGVDIPAPDDDALVPAEADADGTQPFEFTVPASARSFAETRTAPEYPGLPTADDVSVQSFRMHGRPQTVVNPPGGLPATITSLPGTGALDAFIEGIGIAAPRTPGQQAQRARFVADEIADPFVLVGAPTVTVDVALPAPDDTAAMASAPPVEVELFAQLRVETGQSNIPIGGGVAPFTVSLPADGSVQRVALRLPATTWRFEAGDQVRLSVRTTDAGYQGAADAVSVVVDVDDSLELPTIDSTDPAESAGAATPVALIGIPVVLLIALALIVGGTVAARRRARRDAAHPPAPAPALGAAAVGVADLGPAPTPHGSESADPAPPLVIRGLTKDYRSGLRAVDDLTFRVTHGQVLGLLGPNGAGKTTALRMVTGLLRPDAGEVEIFGEHVTPGSPVLRRVGCFIEGPGFLPHLSGRRNLQLYWAASGRPANEARFDEALAIADLGAAVERRVGGYSQGMRQRLAIAQAMLGMPELLILDEPTNGLDPPQIFALRGVLRRYAASGRTVIVSSHLLGEVEQTCTDVVVMARGRLIASGTVAELAGDANELTIEVTDVAAAVTLLQELPGVEASVRDGAAIRVLPGSTPAETVVSTLTVGGIGVRSVVRGRHLEETFLTMVGELTEAR